jgi:hypothetical protein
MTTSLPAPPTAPSAARSSRMRAWPLWATAAGLLGFVATVLTEDRPANGDIDHTVTVDDIPDLDSTVFRIGGFVGYLCVAALVVFAAVWHRRVVQRWAWSLGAPVVTYGVLASAAALALAYGWKGAFGDYGYGAAEHGAFDDQGLYTYFVLNDFSPFIGWVPVTIALFGLAWMAFRERLVSRPLGAFAGVLALLLFAAVAITGVPGLPFASCVILAVAGVWLALGRSPILVEDQP